MSHDPSHEHVAGEAHHIVPVKYYVGVFAALIVLTVFTVYTAKYVDLGNFNLALAMVIAGFKATLVFAIFMGLFWDRSGFNILIILTAVLFFAIFLGITVMDVYTRDSIYAEDAIGVENTTKLRVDGYFEDVPKGGDISTKELLDLRTNTP